MDSLFTCSLLLLLTVLTLSASVRLYLQYTPVSRHSPPTASNYASEHQVYLLGRFKNRKNGASNSSPRPAKPYVMHHLHHCTSAMDSSVRYKTLPASATFLSLPQPPPDQGYGRGGTPVFTGVFEPLARVALYLTDENGLGSCFGAA